MCSVLSEHFNVEKTHSIPATDHEHVWYVTVQAIYWFIDAHCGGRKGLRKLSTGEFCEEYLKPYVKANSGRRDADSGALCFREEVEEMRRSAWKEEVEAYPDEFDPDKMAIYSSEPHGPFVLHAWGANLLRVLDAIERALGKTGFFWFNCFSLNQLSTQKHTSLWWATLFLGTMQTCQEVLMVVDATTVLPFLLLWCQYETLLSIQLGLKFTMLFTASGEEWLKEELDASGKELLALDISIEKAEVSCKPDKEMILDQIGKSNLAMFDRLVQTRLKGSVGGLVQRLGAKDELSAKWLQADTTSNPERVLVVFEDADIVKACTASGCDLEQLRKQLQ